MISSILQVVVIGRTLIKEAEWISLNGSTGEVILGKQPLSPPVLSHDLETFMSWTDEIAHLKVMANADTPQDASTARKNGARGIGLCRTEHMVVFGFIISDHILACQPYLYYLYTKCFVYSVFHDRREDQSYEEDGFGCYT